MTPDAESRARSRRGSRRLMLIAVMTAFSVVGRFIFAPIPFFKPVAAVTALAGMYLGMGAGFAVGALSALLSNIYFGQGPWTPFQMLCWGLIGLAAGALNRSRALEKPLPLALYGVAAGVGYSLIMDICTVLSAGEGLSPAAWIAAVTASLPVMAVYCVSDVVFLLLLLKPVGKRMERIKTKYEV